LALRGRIRHRQAAEDPHRGHQEINASDDEPVTPIVARGGENIVVNVEIE
jgi:hypothetical protein